MLMSVVCIGEMLLCICINANPEKLQCTEVADRVGRAGQCKWWYWRWLSCQLNLVQVFERWFLQGGEGVSVTDLCTLKYIHQGLLWSRQVIAGCMVMRTDDHSGEAYVSVGSTLRYRSASQVTLATMKRHSCLLNPIIARSATLHPPPVSSKRLHKFYALSTSYPHSFHLPQQTVTPKSGQDLCL